MESLVSVILAAGKGKRMKSAKLKVFHKVMGKTVLERAFDACHLKNSSVICVIPEGQQELFKKVLSQNTSFCVQKEQKGTGDAVKSALSLITEKKAREVLVLPGDMPLLTRASIQKLVSFHRKKKNDITVLTSLAHNPKQYGRILRNASKDVMAIVEDKDLTPDQKNIEEINTGVYMFNTNVLKECLEKIRPLNAQKEYYLTDSIAIGVEKQKKVGGLCLGYSDECFGINSRFDLAQAIRLLRERKIESLMESGVTIEDPKSTFIDTDVRIGTDTVIHPFTVITGEVQIGKNCEIGPFAHLHEHVHLKDGACVGNFVEIKKSTLGEGTKAKHLSYLGDATLGKKVNIGAGTITANYDGVRKHPTLLADGCKTGSNTVIVAPNKLGAGTMTGAGTVVLSGKPIPSHSLVCGVPGRIVKSLLTDVKK